MASVRPIGHTRAKPRQRAVSLSELVDQLPAELVDIRVDENELLDGYRRFRRSLGEDLRERTGLSDVSIIEAAVCRQLGMSPADYLDAISPITARDPVSLKSTPGRRVHRDGSASERNR